MLVVDSTKPQVVTFFPDMPRTHEERAQMLFSFGFEIACRKAIGELTAVTFVSEGWMTVLNRSDEKITISPSADPKRVEVLTIIRVGIYEGKKRTKSVLLEMIRDQHDTLIEITEIARFDDREEDSLQSPLLMAFFAGVELGTTNKHVHLN